MVGCEFSLKQDYRDEILRATKNFRWEIKESLETFLSFRNGESLTSYERDILDDLFSRYFYELFYDDILNMGAKLENEMGKYCMICLSEQFKQEICELVLEFFQSGEVSASYDDEENEDI